MKVGKYQLLHRLGGGGFGDVHLALDEGRAVAVKLIHPEVLSDPNSRKRLCREVSTMQKVRSPRVAEIIGWDLEAEQPYVVTQYVQGRPLREVVHDRGPLRGADLAKLARGLAEGLTAIHRQNVVHRDLKPDNVMMVAGDPVIIDFGIAHSIGDTPITDGAIGTLGYMPPEAYNGSAAARYSHSRARDVFSWGGTVAFAAAGRNPYGDDDADRIMFRVLHGQHDLDGVPPPLRQVVELTLATDPSQRPTAPQLIATLRKLPPVLGHSTPGPPPLKTEPARWDPPKKASSAPPTATDIPVPEPPPERETPPQGRRVWKPPPPVRRRERQRWMIIAAGAAIVIIGLLAAVNNILGTTRASDGTSPAAAMPHVRWSDKGNGYYSSAAVAGGTVYIGNGSNVYALDAATGHIRWAHAPGNYTGGRPVVAGGTVYVGGGDDDEVSALDAATGHLRWTYDAAGEVPGVADRISGSVFSSPAVHGGTVYIGGFNGIFYALDATTGHLRWTSATGGVESGPAVDGGTVYIGDLYGGVYALDAATGHLRWASVIAPAPVSSLAVAGGTVCITSLDDKVYAVDAATGNLRWIYTGAADPSGPAVAGGTVYIGSHDNVYALSAAGS